MIRRAQRRRPSHVLGIMSGTSIDGVDFAVCQVSGGGARIRLLQHRHVSFPAGLQRRLEASARGSATVPELAQLHHDLGRFYAVRTNQLFPKTPFELIGLHGQTVFHQPGRRPATLQIGEPAYLAELCRVPVISNFRAGDMAVEGEGAPLVTAFHVTAFGQPGRHRCVHNLGGISNVTSIDRSSPGEPTLLAFDTGPGNVLIDLAVRQFSHGSRRFDRHGNWARQGRIQSGWISRWLEHPYFAKPPPKSTGREMFGESWLERTLSEVGSVQPEDLIATLTELTAASVEWSYRLFLPRLPDEVVLCGGGARNRFLVERITQRLAPTRIVHCTDLGWPEQAVEAAAFALLAFRRICGQPGNVPETTGARRPVLLGQITEL